LAERQLYTLDVTGSSPVPPTSLRSERSDERRLSRRSHAKPSAACVGGRTNTAPRLRLGMPEIIFHYVYILVSECDASRHYTGCTTDLKARLEKHNRGDVPHTAKFKPWRMEMAIRFSSCDKARAFEQYLKSGSGREFARRHF
jgi:putative endonuclease